MVVTFISLIFVLLSSCQFLHVDAQYTLFNGGENTLFSNASSACLGAFNATLSCAKQVQLLSYDLSYLDFAQSDFTALCTSSCASSLTQLKSSVGLACGSYTTGFNGAPMNMSQVVDYYNFKYNLVCLKDTSTGQFCELQQQGWNISQLNISGKAIWPTYTNKIYPNWYLNDDGSPLQDPNGTYIDPFDRMQVFTPALNGTQNLNIKDFYVNASAYAGNYGLDPAGPDFDADELPLQYQCSSCAVNRYMMGYQSTWGHIFEYVARSEVLRICANST
jgi:hypothetical protein